MYRRRHRTSVFKVVSILLLLFTLIEGFWTALLLAVTRSYDDHLKFNGYFNNINPDLLFTFFIIRFLFVLLHVSYLTFVVLQNA